MQNPTKNRQILVMVMAWARRGGEVLVQGVQGAPLPYCAPEEVCSPAQRTPGPVLHICTHTHTTRRLPQVSPPVQFKCSLLCAGLRWPCSVWRGVVTFKHVNNAAVKRSPAITRPQVERWRRHITHQQDSQLPLVPAPLLHIQPSLRHAFCPPPLVTERSSQKPQSRTIKQNVIHHDPVRRRI